MFLKRVASVWSALGAAEEANNADEFMRRRVGLIFLKQRLPGERNDTEAEWARRRLHTDSEKSIFCSSFESDFHCE